MLDGLLSRALLVRCTYNGALLIRKQWQRVCPRNMRVGIFAGTSHIEDRMAGSKMEELGNRNAVHGRCKLRKGGLV